MANTTTLSLTIQREVANCIIVGARNARGGEHLGTDGVLSDGIFHLFDSIMPQTYILTLFIVQQQLKLESQRFSLGLIGRLLGYTWQSMIG
eukprot:4232211-Pyramimonas_sp.AAC.1